VSAFSHTDWTVICNGTKEDGSPCPLQLCSADFDLRDGTAAYVRKALKARGWLVSVHGPADGSRRVQRLDYCPGHKSQADQVAAPAAGEKE
jgi:hypothetical protein